MINTDFDNMTAIAGLSVNNIEVIEFENMLAVLAPFVLVQVPEDTETVEERRRLDYLLARCANLHSFLLVLWSQATYLRATMKKYDPENAELMQKKKEVLYELAGAMKLKYEACSRKITVLLEEEGDSKVNDRVNYDARREARDAFRGATTKENATGWSAVK